MNLQYRNVKIFCRNCLYQFPNNVNLLNKMELYENREYSETLETSLFLSLYEMFIFLLHWTSTL